MTDPAVFLREFARDRAEQVVETPGGFAVLSPRRFPHAHDHNELWVFRAVDPPDLLAAAEAVLAPYDHRRLEVYGDAVTPEFTAALRGVGYERDGLLVMTHVRPADGDRPSADGLVELSLADRIAVADRVWSADPTEAVSSVRRELAERARSAVRAADCTFLGVVGDDGAVQASCDLFVRGDTAQIEEVVTLPAYRGRGHARRLVQAAIDRAEPGGAGRVFLVADADDWPKNLYARLGFDVTERAAAWSRGGGPVSAR